MILPLINVNISANYAVALEGNFTLVYGTSASSPVVGSIITMINDARIAKGKSPVGMLCIVTRWPYSDCI